MTQVGVRFEHGGRAGQPTHMASTGSCSNCREALTGTLWPGETATPSTHWFYDNGLEPLKFPRDAPN